MNTDIEVRGTEPRILAFDLKTCTRQVVKLFNDDVSTSDPVIWFSMDPRDGPDDLYRITFTVHFHGDNITTQVFKRMDDPCRFVWSFLPI